MNLLLLVLNQKLRLRVMSSHHFVKEGQEPALLIVDPFSFELAQPLFEWAPLVMVADAALDAVLQWGIKIDVILAASSQVESIKQKVLEQMPVEFAVYNPAGHALQTGINFLTDRHQLAINVMAKSDLSVFTLLQGLSPRLTLTLLSADLKWSFIRAGVYKKWFPAQAHFKTKSLYGHALSVQGAHLVEHDGYSATASGQVVIQSDASFWVGEPFV